MFKKRSPKGKRVRTPDSDIEEITILDDDSREAVKQSKKKDDNSDVDSDVSLE